jgi:hypothetical protein
MHKLEKLQLKQKYTRQKYLARKKYWEKRPRSRGIHYLLHKKRSANKRFAIEMRWTMARRAQKKLFAVQRAQLNRYTTLIRLSTGCRCDPRSPKRDPKLRTGSSRGYYVNRVKKH